MSAKWIIGGVVAAAVVVFAFFGGWALSGRGEEAEATSPAAVSEPAESDAAVLLCEQIALLHKENEQLKKALAGCQPTPTVAPVAAEPVAEVPAEPATAPAPLSPQEEKEYGVGSRLAENPSNLSAVLPETGMYFGGAADNITQEKLERTRFRERRKARAMELAQLEAEREELREKVESAQKNIPYPGKVTKAEFERISNDNKKLREKLTAVESSITSVRLEEPH